MASGIVTIGTLTTKAGFEWFPSIFQPSFKLWIASTGEAIVFSSSILHEVMHVSAGRRYVLLAFLYGDV